MSVASSAEPKPQGCGFSEWRRRRGSRQSAGKKVPDSFLVKSARLEEKLQGRLWKGFATGGAKGERSETERERALEQA